MNIPPALDILARASDLRHDAQRQRDTSAVNAYNAVIVTVVCHYGSLAWDGQYLTVASLSHPGQTHQVSAFGCSCEAKRPCFHMRLRELLIGIFETDCDTADMASDPPNEGPSLGDEEGDSLPARPLAPRIAAARRAYAYL